MKIKKCKTTTMFGSLSIRKKFMVLYSAIMVFIVIALSAYFYIIMRNNALEASIVEAKSQTQNISIKVLSALDKAIKISDQMAVDKQLYKIITHKYSSAGEVFDDYFNHNYMKYLLTINQGLVKEIVIYSPNETLLNSVHIKRYDKNNCEYEWLKKFLDSNNLLQWVSADGISNASNDIMLLKKIYVNDEFVAVLRVAITLDSIVDRVSTNDIDCVVLNNFKKVIYSNMSEIDKQIAFENNLSMKKTDYANVYDAKMQKKSYKVFLQKVKTRGLDGKFEVVTLFSLESIFKSVDHITFVVILIVLIALLVGLIFIYVISKLISNRIVFLGKEMKGIVKSKFSGKVTVNSKDEIGELADNVNLMIDEINSLVNEIYVMNENEKELITNQNQIQLEMLASQINPHFIFNTLETLRMKAHNEGVEELADVIQKFGVLLRASITSNNESVYLSKEIQFVEDYLFIQKYRFGEKIKYDISSSVAQDSIKVLPLLVQPIVENAVIHGIETIEEDGKIDINIYDDCQYLYISIADNGIGIEPGKLDELRNRFNSVKNEDNGKHIGLINVYKRMKLFYGDKADLIIESTINKGTNMKLIIPKEKLQK